MCKKILTLVSVLYIINIGLVGCATLMEGTTLSKDYLIENFATLYEPNIHTVAILPFANTSGVSDADVDLRKEIEKNLRPFFNNDRSKLFLERGSSAKVLELDYVDNILKKNGIDSYAAISNYNKKELGRLLGVDAIMTGNIRIYPEKFSFNLFKKQNLDRIETQLQIYYCEDNELIWEGVITSKDIIMGDKDFSLGNYTSELKIRWPFKEKAK